MTEEASVVHIPGGLVGAGSVAMVFMLDPDGSSGPCRHRGVKALADFELGFLVGGEDKVVGIEGLVFPSTVVEIEHPLGLGHEERIAREDPA